MYKLRTVDVWDTLLRRNCHPECIKLSTAFHIYVGFHGQIKNEFPSHREIYQKRLQIESQLAALARAAGKDDEYDIREVVRLWLDCVVGPGETVHEIVDYEIATEMASCYPDEDIVGLLQQYPGEKTIFLSDFYMTAEMIQRLLENAGLSSVVASGISSSDVGLNKRSGKLFDFVHSQYRVGATDHLHIGDNLYSDVESARQRGITAVHYLPEKSHETRLARERLFISRDILFEHVRDQARSHGSAKVELLNPEQAAAYRFGVEAAPLFIGFCLFIAEQAVKNRLESVHFMTREGEFFHRLCRILYPEKRFFGHGLPEFKILEVSRLATFAASMEEVSVFEMKRIWRLFRTQKIDGLFTTLGLDLEKFSTLLHGLGLSKNTVIENPDNDGRIVRLFQSEEFLAAAQESIRTKRSLAKQYLDYKGLDQTKNIGVVDIGWRGSIQDNIALLYPQSSVHGFYLALRTPVNPQPANVHKSAYAINELHNLDWPAYFESFAVLEMICNSPNGSVEGYRRNGNDIIAERLIHETENESFQEYTAFFQEGVASAAAAWKPYVESYVVTADEMRDQALHVWKKLQMLPPASMVDTFLRAPQHDIFGYGEIYSRTNVPSLLTIGLSPINKGARRELIDFVKRVQWTSAINHLKGISPLHRLALKTVFTAAHSVKTSRAYRRRLGK